MAENQEQQRLKEAQQGTPWRLWGPYLSERQWGTVREDYSENGDAWNYFPHDQARSRAYRWGEDGLAGFCDDHSRLCLALALWNGKDPIIKERLFGLTNSEGNHGEDVKEYYYYLDGTPTHSYMKCLYKYPQAAYPYNDIIRTNRSRTRRDPEYELIDTGVFSNDRYFDVFVEYAKAAPEDILILITVHNRGPENASLHVLPTLWFRNVWQLYPDLPRPTLRKANGKTGMAVIGADHSQLGAYSLYCEAIGGLGGVIPELLFTENETNNQRIFGSTNATPYVKDAFDQFLVHGRKDAVNPAATGTKAAAHYLLDVPGGRSAAVRLRLRPTAAASSARHLPFADFDKVLTARLSEADEFYKSVTPARVDAEEARVMRQAYAGMLWTKQHYFLDLDHWLREHNHRKRTQAVRNREWFHMYNDDVISMPDKWEYPWYAAWDLAFHAIAFTTIDLDFAKQQINLMLRDVYLHPSGAVPAYEWNFSDVNPPVHAWATWFIYQSERSERGEGDLDFLKSAFHKLMLNFTWWVNRKDPTGANVFEGGFLGLDNIGIFDRSRPLPTGGSLEQADGTAWMALFAQNMLSIALEIASHDRSYADVAYKFVEHFLWIATALNNIGGAQEGMWDEQDGFYYDLLRLPDGRSGRLKVRSLVGLLPMCAVTVIENETRERFPEIIQRLQRFASIHPDIATTMSFTRNPGVADRRLLSLVSPDRLRRVLSRMLDPNEFLSDHGIRSLSRYHLEHPYMVDVHGEEYTVSYLPAESDTGMFGGNSNWRGPIWFPMNTIIIRALLVLYSFHGNDFKVECPTGSGHMMNLFEVSKEIVDRLTRIFLPGKDGRRPVFGSARKFQDDPNWRDHLLFYEYFHGDNGAGLGASHQTGWTGTIGKLIELYGRLDPQKALQDTRTVFQTQR